MNGFVEILTGVARSGKTARLLDEYRRALAHAQQDLQLGTTLWLTPTQRARQGVLAVLLDGSLKVCFAPHVFTFDGFAERILQAGDQPVTSLSPAGQRSLLRRLIDECLHAGELRYFAPIAGTVGFLDLVMSFISELKRDEIWPEHFLEACRSRGLSARDRELALLYSRYQDGLQRTGRYDAQGLFWSARTALFKGAGTPIERFSLVVVDGFTDFTGPQYEILAKLADLSDRVLISLPLETPLERNDLFAKSARALQRLEQMADSGVNVSVSHCRRTQATTPPAIDHIADELFSNPRRVRRSSDGQGLQLRAVAGQRGEVQMLARQVKRLLLDGVKARDIVVAFRSPGEYVQLIDEVFTAAGIPYWCEAGFPVTRSPVVKALFAVLDLELDDWPFERLMAVLDSNYFRPGWGSWRNGEAARDVAAELRRLKIDSGRAVMLNALRPTAASSHGSADENAGGDFSEGSPETSRSHSAFALLDELNSATGSLRDSADIGTWAERLFQLAGALGIAADEPSDTGSPETAARETGSALEESTDDAALRERDRRHWERFKRILKEAVEADTLLESVSPQLTLDGFTSRLRELLAHESTPPDENDASRVLVLHAPQLRNLDVDYLFLAGLSETSFPSRRSDDCLYGELERRRLSEHGLLMNLHATHHQDELLLFSMIVTRARRQLVLSYPSVSGRGQPLFASPYVRAIEELFEPEALDRSSQIDLDPVPCRDSMLTPADLRLVATSELQDGRADLFRTMSDRQETAATSGNILAAVDAAAARFHTRGFTAFEGMVQTPRFRARLRERFAAGHQFSATRLEAYAGCPYRFFLSDVLGIEPPESPTAATDPMSRGTLVHDVLAAVHREFVDGGKETADALVSRFREGVDKQLRRRVAATELQAALTRIEREVLHDWAGTYAAQWESYVSSFSEAWDDAPRPALLEARFGKVPEQPGDTESSSFAAFTFGTGKRQTLVRGRIDRIDVGRFEGQTVFNVIDYKTGKPPRFSPDDVESGRAIQLALYTLAVDRLGLAGPDARPFQIGYWSLRDKGFVGRLKGSGRKQVEPVDAAVVTSLEAILEDLIPRMAEHIRHGDFPVYSQDADCTGWCPYSTVCRVNQIRPLEESLDKTWSLAGP